MSITLSKVEYINIGSISGALADFLDTLSPAETPTRLHLSPGDSYHLLKLRDYADKNPDEASVIDAILKEVNASGGMDIAWG